MFAKRRSTNEEDGGVVASRTVRNSIRPPPAYSRQQHIESYLQDQQLAPSTRKVSPDGMCRFFVFFISNTAFWKQKNVHDFSVIRNTHTYFYFA